MKVSRPVQKSDPNKMIINRKSNRGITYQEYVKYYPGLRVPHQPLFPTLDNIIGVTVVKIANSKLNVESDNQYSELLLRYQNDSKEVLDNLNTRKKYLEDQLGKQTQGDEQSDGEYLTDYDLYKSNLDAIDELLTLLQSKN